MLRAPAIAAFAATAALGARGAPARAQAPRAASADSAAAAAVVGDFHRALSEGDSAAALALLTEDAVVLEGGSLESREEYRAHHLAADIGFARAVKGTRSPVRVTVRGDVAWAASTTTSRGNYRGRPVYASGAELMVLTRTAGGWRISAIHWSSRNRRS